jgi:hypothetical protein
MKVEFQWWWPIAACAVVAAFIEPPKPRPYWFKNTFQRADWAKETCSKWSVNLISMNEAGKRLDFSPVPFSLVLETFCRSYGVDNFN